MHFAKNKLILYHHVAVSQMLLLSQINSNFEKTVVTSTPLRCIVIIEDRKFLTLKWASFWISPEKCCVGIDSSYKSQVEEEGSECAT